MSRMVGHICVAVLVASVVPLRAASAAPAQVTFCRQTLPVGTRTLRCRTSGRRGQKQSLRTLSSFTELRSLDLSGQQFSDYAAIGSLKKLRKLEIRQEHCVPGRFSGTGPRKPRAVVELSFLAGLTHLEELDLSLPAKSLKPLKDLKRLKKLSLEVLGSPDLSFLESLVRLEILEVNVEHLKMPSIQRLVRLRKVRISGNTLDLKNMPPAKSVRALTLVQGFHGCSGTEEMPTKALDGRHLMKRFPKLRSLSLEGHGSAFTTFDFTNMPRNTALKKMYLGGDIMLKPWSGLARFKGITDLTLEHLGESIPTLDPIGKLTRLRKLSLIEATESEIKSLRALWKLKRLRFFQIAHTFVPRIELKKLRKRLPKLRIKTGE